ncbi:dephospho-CoA kinase [Planococcus lenghuensis]|uniref:Dephospho-CoA kinase n=1 Tax=Planococcus lenghuensis TaxID=2213202 RepID=A0A1Q2KXJ1_9BACL|nr:dephospho-CoA kinase [Planococcus lenghuensis]AQQ52824.1 dephospho-CoA kinase [Planococcus lenghuensis]
MIIGLTGSIASGKSTVAAMLKEKGYALVDADAVARQVVEPGTETLARISRAFGEDVLQADKTLNREKLGALIFNDPNSRKKLNDIIHPAIRQEMLRQREEWLANGAQTVIMDIPLLFESKLEHFADKILVVSVSEENQLARLMQRNGLTAQDARARISSQLPVSEKEKRADAVIYNNGSIAETERQLEWILEKWNAAV